MDGIELSQRSSSVCSSVKDAAWHQLTADGSYECWHFDAVSDDGREALIVNFYDNYVLSPRYYDRLKMGMQYHNDATAMSRVPAVSFSYAVDGKIVFRAVNEFRAGEFNASTDRIGVRIAGCEFHSDEIDYGKGYILKLSLRTIRGRQINAEIEWLFVEADLSPLNHDDSVVTWNIVAPRSDVSGRISLVGRGGETRKIVHFRGTGYHDHLRFNGSAFASLGTRVWGRAHFVDATAIFCHREHGEERMSKLFIVRDSKMNEMDIAVENLDIRRGFRDRLSLSANGVALTIDAHKKISSDPSEKTMLSDVMLDLPGEHARTTMGLTGLVEPSLVGSGVSRWISDLRIGRENRSPLF